MNVRTLDKAGKYEWQGYKNECTDLPTQGACKECCQSYFKQVGRPEPSGYCEYACKSLP